MYTHKLPPSRGFTLVEVLVVAPLVILVVSIIIGAMVSLTGDALMSRKRISNVYTTQLAFDRIEKDILVTTSILSTSGSLQSPQGQDDATAAFSSPSTQLILRQVATTKNPFDDSRGLVYIANSPNSCSTADGSNNALLYITTIYFQDGKDLKRRTIVPAATTCAQPWQRNSCRNGASTTNICRAKDEILATDVTSFSVKYFDGISSTVNVATPTGNTKTAEVTISTASKVAGESITYTSSVRANMINR